VGFDLDALLEVRSRCVHRNVIEVARVILDEEVLRLGVDPRVHLMRLLVEGERQLELAVQPFEKLNTVWLHELIDNGEEGEREHQESPSQHPDDQHPDDGADDSTPGGGDLVHTTRRSAPGRTSIESGVR